MFIQFLLFVFATDTLFGLLDCDYTHANGACSLAYVPIVSNKENVAPSL